MATYLASDAFDLLYPDEGPLGQGGYSLVRKSGTHALKLIKGRDDDTTWRSASVELNLYATVRHPCVAQLDHWTIDLSGPALVIKLALPLGQDVAAAIIEHKLTFEQVASDLLSALSIIHQAGFGHNDIKPANCVYLAGRVQLIDFGLASGLNWYKYVSSLGETTSEVIIDEAGYSPFYRDPEITLFGPQSVKVEMYAIATTLYNLFVDERGVNIIGWPLSQHNSYPSLSPRETRLLHDLTHYPLSSRGDIVGLFNRFPYLTLTTGVIVQTPILPMYTKCREDILGTMGIWLLQICLSYQLAVRSLFLALTLFRRVLAIILPDYVALSDQRALVKLIAVTCLKLAADVADQASPISLDVIYSLTDKVYSRHLINKYMSEVLQVCKGVIVTKTPWTQAQNLEELPTAFLDLLSCDYNPDLILRVTGHQSKQVNMATFAAYAKQAIPGLDITTSKHNVAVAILLYATSPRVEAKDIEPILGTFSPSGITLPGTLNDRIRTYNQSKQTYTDNIDFAHDILGLAPGIKLLQRSNPLKYQEALELLAQTKLGTYLLAYF